MLLIHLLTVPVFPMNVSRYFLCVASLLSVLTSPVLAASAQPNVLFISVDDLKPLLGVYGSAEVKSPNIDRLASAGTTMMNNHCQQAVCAPSRMSAFTGLRPDSTRIWDLRTKIQDTRPDAVTMQQHFREAGYVTAGAGKIMHGARAEHPPSWSIPYVHHRNLPFNPAYPVPAHDNAFYQNAKSHAVYNRMNDEGVRNWRARMAYMQDAGAMPSTEALDIPDDAYVDGAIAKWGSARLEEFSKGGDPFFLTLGFCKPHLPFVAPRKYWEMYEREAFDLAAFQRQAKDSPDFAYHSFGELRSYTDISRNFSEPVPDDKARELIHGYYACVSYIDAQIGKVLDKLEALGLAENTIIVLYGDHGWHLGDHGMWCKHSNFEQATKSPLIITAPGFDRGQKATGPTEFVDIFPTLVELAGLKGPAYPLEGKSLVPVLRDPSTRVKPFAISQYPRGGGRMGYALRNDRYRYVLWMRGQWRSTMPFKPELVEAVELYDYEKDPLETVNFAGRAEYATAEAGLRKQMLDFFASQVTTPEPIPEPVGGRIEPGSSGTFIDLATIDLAAIDKRFASVDREGADLVITFGDNPRWPSIEFTASEANPWDLRGYEGVSLRLTNESAEKVRISAYLAMPGDLPAIPKRNGARADLAPGQTTDLEIPFDATAYPLDLGRLTQLRIFVIKNQRPATFRLSSIRALQEVAGFQPAGGVPTVGKPSGEDATSRLAGTALFDVGTYDPAKTTTRFASVSRGKDAMRLSFEVNNKWPSVDFMPTAADVWNLSGRRTVTVRLRNDGAETVKAFAYIATPEDTHADRARIGAKVDIRPGQIETVTLDLSQAAAEGFDPARTGRLRVFTGNHQAPVNLSLLEVTVN